MGKVTGHCDPAQETAASLSRMMIGDTIAQHTPDTHTTPGVSRLQIKNLSKLNNSANSNLIQV